MICKAYYLSLPLSLFLSVSLSLIRATLAICRILPAILSMALFRIWSVLRICRALFRVCRALFRIFGPFSGIRRPMTDDLIGPRALNPRGYGWKNARILVTLWERYMQTSPLKSNLEQEFYTLPKKPCNEWKEPHNLRVCILMSFVVLFGQSSLWNPKRAM